LASLDLLPHLAFAYLLPIADHWGRFEYDPRAIWARTCAYRGDITLEVLQGWLDALEKAGLFQRYGDGKFAAWMNFQGMPKSQRNQSAHPEPPFDNALPMEGVGIAYDVPIHRRGYEEEEEGKGFFPLRGAPAPPDAVSDGATEAALRVEAEIPESANAGAPEPGPGEPSPPGSSATPEPQPETPPPSTELAPGPPARSGPILDKDGNWSLQNAYLEAAEDWEARTQGLLAIGRLGKALKPWIRRQARKSGVGEREFWERRGRGAWRNYLTHENPDYRSVERFVARPYGTPGEGHIEQQRVKEAVGRGDRDAEILSAAEEGLRRARERGAAGRG
jgi:hypothetical protein